MRENDTPFPTPSSLRESESSQWARKVTMGDSALAASYPHFQMCLNFPLLFRDGGCGSGNLFSPLFFMRIL